ncbi:MAG: bifunctional folylpolyglutamate synthase/dihydrofolate synthase [Anaerolineae bacterium]
MVFDRYYQALEYIKSFIWGSAEACMPPHLMGRVDPYSLRPKRTKYFLQMIGDPQEKLRIIHVGGTSGKGSTLTLAGAILQAAGFTVGTHTTPYLQTPIEKMKVNDLYISPLELADLVEEVKASAELTLKENPYGLLSYGELWVALTFSYFARAAVDLALIEVGVGGRYDCTNVITPLLSVITTISHDHTDVLGKTLPEIAYHKAGIIKEGVPVVTGVQQPEALKIIRRECLEKGADLIELGKEISYKVRTVDSEGGTFDYRGLQASYQSLRVRLLGGHQIVNATLAVAIIESLAKYHHLHVPEEAVRLGLEKARIYGRLEVIQRQPTVILDGAHNEEKARALRKSISNLFGPKRLILVIGILESKSVPDILAELVPSADVVVVTAPEVMGKPATPPSELGQEAGSFGREVVVIGDPLEAIQHALDIANPEDLICVTGSLYLVGAVRSFWVPEAKILKTGTLDVDEALEVGARGA